MDDVADGAEGEGDVLWDVVWDVAVAGAGPAGSVAASVLARAGRRVLLIDGVVEQEVRIVRRKVGESLPGAARPLLRDLELLERVESGPHLPSYGRLSAWGSDELRTTDSLRDPHGPGWHLDRPRFDADLRASAVAAGAEVCPAFVRSVERDGRVWRLGGPAGGVVAARRLIDATGRHAAIARALGVERRRDDRLVAICAWTGSRGEDTRTLVEATADGWWYTAGLPGGERVVVLHVDAESARELLGPGDSYSATSEGAGSKGGSKRVWHRRLAATRHVRRVIDGAEIFEGPRATEACGARLDRFAGDGWLAVGDAALSFDPLSSQGLLDALYTGLRGAEATGAALDGEDGASATGDAGVEAYVQRLESIRDAYLRQHRAYYRSETRWPDRPFWRRRRGSGG